MVDQYLRKVSIIVADKTGKGLELSDLAVRFQVHHSTFTTPHTAELRIYNLSNETSRKINEEFTSIIIQAGYEGNYGTIFIGTIKQVQRGRENGTDSFLAIYAADGDQWHNNAVMNVSLAAGHTQTEVWTTIADAIKPTNSISPLPEGINTARAPRGRVFFGMVRDYLRDFANSNDLLVTTDNGTVSAMPLLAYKPGDAVVLNSETGMLGAPEQTPLGITATCLLNPAISWGTRIQINQKDIAQSLKEQIVIVPGMGYTDIMPSTSADGFYKVLIVDHFGNTRGNEFYTDIVAISIDPTAQYPYGTQGGIIKQRVGGA